MGERILGIVGGMGPESSLDYYRSIVDRWRDAGPPGTYPRLLIDSLESGHLIETYATGDGGR